MCLSHLLMGIISIKCVKFACLMPFHNIFLGQVIVLLNMYIKYLKYENFGFECYSKFMRLNYYSLFIWLQCVLWGRVNGFAKFSGQKTRN